MLAPLLFNMFLVALVNVAHTHIKVDKDIMDALIHLSKKKEGGGAGGRNCPKVDPVDAVLGAYLTLTMPGSSRNPSNS